MAFLVTYTSNTTDKLTYGNEYEAKVDSSGAFRVKNNVGNWSKYGRKNFIYARDIKDSESSLTEEAIKELMKKELDEDMKASPIYTTTTKVEESKLTVAELKKALERIDVSAKEEPKELAPDFETKVPSRFTVGQTVIGVSNGSGVTEGRIYKVLQIVRYAGGSDGYLIRLESEKGGSIKAFEHRFEAYTEEVKTKEEEPVDKKKMT